VGVALGPCEAIAQGSGQGQAGKQGDQQGSGACLAGWLVCIQLGQMLPLFDILVIALNLKCANICGQFKTSICKASPFDRCDGVNY